MVPENEKLPGCCCKSRGEGEIEFPPVDDGVSLIEALTAVELNFYQSVIFMHSRDFNRINKEDKKNQNLTVPKLLPIIFIIQAASLVF